MTLGEQINQQLRQAFKERQKQKVAALRLVVAALTNQRIAKGGDLTDDEVIKVLQGEAKKRRESLEIYKKAKREDLASQEAFELETIQTFLPQAMSTDELKKIVSGLKAAGKLGTNFGEAMKQVMAQVGGRADGRTVAEIVKESL